MLKSKLTWKTPTTTFSQVARVSDVTDEQQMLITQQPWLPLQIHLASLPVKSPLNTVLLCDWIKEVGRLADCFMQIVGFFSVRQQVVLKSLEPTCFKVVLSKPGWLPCACCPLKKKKKVLSLWSWHCAEGGPSDTEVAQKIQN